MTTAGKKIGDTLVNVGIALLMLVVLYQFGQRQFGWQLGPARALPLPPTALSLIGQPVPDLSSLVALPPTSASGELGKRTSLVVFMRTTCPACNAAKPFIEKLRARHPEAGFLAIFTETSRVVDAYDITLPKALDNGRMVSDHLKVNSIPAFYVFRDGKVSAQLVGWTDDYGRTLERQLK